jgi:hypothetical protein
MSSPTRLRLVLLATLTVAGIAVAATITPWIDSPEITEGSAWSDGFFTGDITMEAAFEDPGLGLGLQGEVTLEACDGGCPTGRDCAIGVDWLPAAIDPDLGDDRQIASGQVQYPDAVALRDGSGRTVVVYEKQTSAGLRVRARFLAASGAVSGSEMSVPSPTGGGDQMDPKVAALDSGRFVVVWTAPDADDLGVWRQVFSASGSKVGGAARVNGEQTGRQYRPDVAGSAAGSFVVVWSGGWDPLDPDTRDEPEGLSLQARTFSSSNQPTELETVEGSSTEPSWPAITDVPGGGWFVAWSELDGSYVRGRYLRANGTVQGSRFAVASSMPDARHVAVAAAPDGGQVAVAWEAGTHRQVQVRAFVGNSPRFSAKTVASSSSSVARLRPALAFVDDTGLTVAWAEVQSSGAGMLAVRVLDTDTGAFFGPTEPLDDGTTIVTSPTLTRRPDDTLVAAWGARSSLGADRRIRARTVAPAGVLVAEDVPHGDQDIDVQFRWTDASGSHQCSAVGSWYWANPAAGGTGSMTYDDTFTNATSVPIEGAFSPGPDAQFLALTLWTREAPLMGGACGDWGSWTQLQELVPSMSVSAVADLEAIDTTCVQYRWHLTNRARVDHQHASAAIVRIDRVPPEIETCEHAVDGDEVAITLACQDVHSGIADADVVIAEAAPAPIDPNGTTAVGGLVDGANPFTVTVRDLPGNDSHRLDYAVADLATPEVIILSIDEGGTYGQDVPLLYQVVGDVTDLALTLNGDGLPLSDLLTDLPEGAHSLELVGVDPDGALVSDAVSFTVVPGLFTAFLTAPQPLAYEDDRIVAAWWASAEPSSLTLSLDGGPMQASPTFEGLTDGEHTLALEATAADGQVATDQVTFTTEEVVPSIQILAPQEGDVLPSGEVEVLCLTLADVVTWQVGALSGSLDCGDRIPDGPPLPDGPHTLFLTVDHANGNTATEAVSFEVDSRPLELTLLSPQPGIYDSGDIPVQYTTTAPVDQVELTLDGDEVETLQGLTPGSHALLVEVTAASGLSAQAMATFTVVPFAITSPTPGQEVPSPELPPEAPVIYSGGEGCSSVTASIDDGAEALITAGPGQPTHLPMSKGGHTLRLSCHVGTFVATRAVDFEIGELNVSVGPNSIGYATDNCTADWDCDVTVTITVANTGDFDVHEPFEVRFDHLRPDGVRGSDTQVATFDPLPEGAEASATLATFPASLEDRFVIQVDPAGQLAGETLHDNYAELVFLAASLDSVSLVFGEANHFLSGSTLVNGITATSSGPVDHLRVHGGDLAVLDETEDAGTWHALADMGLLAPDDDCVTVSAIGENGVALDSQAACFAVSTTPLAPEGLFFPWDNWTQGGEVTMAELDRSALLTAEATALHDAMVGAETPLVPWITETGTVAYMMLAKVGEVDEPIEVDMGSEPVVGGSWLLPTKTALFSIYINPFTGTCGANGSLMVDLYGLDGFAETAAENYLDGVSQDVVDSIDLEQLIDDLDGVSLASVGLPYGSHTSLVAAAWDGPWGLGAYTAGFLSTELTAPTWEVDVLQTEVEASYEVTGSCSISLSPGGPGLSISLDEAKLSTELDADIRAQLDASTVDYLGVAAPSFMWIPIPVLAGFVRGHAEVHPQELVIPAHSEFEATVSLDPATLLTGTAEATVDLTLEHGPTAFMSGSAVGYPVIGLGFGFGQDFRADWMLDAWGRIEGQFDYDILAGTSTGGSGGDWRFFLEAETWRRNRYCFLAWCWWGDWSHVDTTPYCAQGDDSLPGLTDPCPCLPADQLSSSCFEGADSLPF